MALAKVYSTARSDFGTATSTPYTRGIILNAAQVELMTVSKLTGDTTGTVTLSNIRRPDHVYAFVTQDSAGANQTTTSLVSVAYTHNSDTSISFSGLGNWTRAVLFITGRSYV